MEKIKEKYGLIIGLVTLMILVSNFRDKLDTVNIDIGFYNFTLTEFYLMLVTGISICIYLYVFEAIFRDTRIGNWKLFAYLIRLAYFIFGFVILSPLILLLILFIYQLIKGISNTDEATLKSITTIVAGLLGVATSYLANRLSSRFLKEKAERQQSAMEEEEIRDLDSSIKLFGDGYYSQSILEAFKVMEIHLFRMLSKKDIRVRRHKLQDLIDKSLKEEILNNNDLGIIKEIRNMRNAAAHLDIAHNKTQAEMAIRFIKELIKRTASQ